MEKLEIRGDELYSIKETKVDGIDVEREIAVLEDQLESITEKLKVYKNLKVKKDGKSVSGDTTSTK